MIIKNFTIPSPIIADPLCEYFSVEYRKTAPVLGIWQTIPNFTTQIFSLSLDFNSIYEIRAKRHCCDDGESAWTYTTFDTNTNFQTIYVCLQETNVLDTCSTTPGTCRDCEVKKSYKLKFFSNNAGTTPVNIPTNMVVKFQETINGVLQPPNIFNISQGNSEYNIGVRTTYQEVCSSGNSIITTKSYNILDGQFEEHPYRVITCINNTPTIVNETNTSTGPGGIRTQTFRVGIDILPGNRYQMIAYSAIRELIAITGDTPTSIAQRLKDLINNTTVAQWNVTGSAPIGAAGFKPTATSSGAVLTVQLDHVHSFACSAYQY